VITPAVRSCWPVGPDLPVDIGARRRRLTVWLLASHLPVLVLLGTSLGRQDPSPDWVQSVPAVLAGLTSLIAGLAVVLCRTARAAAVRHQRGLEFLLDFEQVVSARLLEAGGSVAGALTAEITELEEIAARVGAGAPSDHSAAELHRAAQRLRDVSNRLVAALGESDPAGFDPSPGGRPAWAERRVQLVRCSVRLTPTSRRAPRANRSRGSRMARNTDRNRNSKRAPAAARPRRGKPKVCIFCRDAIDWVDYKDANLLGRFLSERAKIKARRTTGNCNRHQREVALAIKTSRELALLPYTRRTVAERLGGRGGRGGGGGRGGPGGRPPRDQESAAPEAAIDGIEDTMDIGDVEDTGAEEWASARPPGGPPDGQRWRP
jgi:small subunit ribosomal protein S18